MHDTLRKAASAALCALLIGAPAPARARAASEGASGGVSVFSLAIGYNHPEKKGLARLRYADDDAVNNHRLMRTLGAQSLVLTQLDGQTRELFPSLAVTAPSKRALHAAWRALNQRIAEARRRGRRTVLYVFYSGHGDVDGGEGYVQLQGSRLRRSEMLELLRRSRAHRNHVVVDACNSYYLIFARGPGGKRRKAESLLLAADAQLPANSGFLLSTSSAQESHEWAAFQGGIFSHEVRSALRGAADVDRDGVVTYEEVAAFVYTANQSVKNRRFRPRFHIRSPKSAPAARSPLVDLRQAAGRRILFDAKLGRRLYVEDLSGTRLADLHPGRRPVQLVVPGRERLFIREWDSRREYAVPAGRSVVRFARLQARQSTSRTRGAAHEAFRRLFRRSFDGRALVAYRERPRLQLDEPAPAAQRSAVWWLRPALGIFSLVALATGGAFTAWAAIERAGVTEDSSNAARSEVNATITRNNTVAIVGYALGALAGAAYLTWTFWPRPDVELHISPRVSPTGQAQLLVSW